MSETHLMLFLPDHNNDLLFPEPEEEPDAASSGTAGPTKGKNPLDSKDDYPVLIRVDRNRPTGKFRKPRPGDPRSKEYRRM